MRDLTILQSRLAELQTIINDYETKEQELQNQIDALQEQQDAISSESWKYASEANHINREINTEKLVNRVFALTPDNSHHITLSSSTKTTPIMDSFCHSGKSFLVFEDWAHYSCHFMEQSSMCVCTYDLIVIRHNGTNDILLHSNQLTMTDLKQHSGILRGNSNKEYHNSRFEGLMHELVQMPCIGPNEKKVIPFEVPVMLGGQTFANQTGYGSAYEGSYLLHQGTLYGETTSFLIIGAIVSSYRRW